MLLYPNWHRGSLEVRMPKGVRVRVPSVVLFRFHTRVVKWQTQQV